MLVFILIGLFKVFMRWDQLLRYFVAQGLEKNLFKLDSLIDTRPFKISSKKLKINTNSIIKVQSTR